MSHHSQAALATLEARIHREARRVTSYDVAILAGVSQSAVSRCFKPGASVSKLTMERVMQAAAALDYAPNAVARSLITKRSNMVAVLISNLVNLYYPDVLSELSREFTLRGKRILLFSLGSEAEVDRVLPEIWPYQIDGAVVAARLSAAQVAEFERHRVPLVMFNRSVADTRVNLVACDQAGGSAGLIERLAAAGHRRFALMAGPEDSYIGQERKRGALEALARLGLPKPDIAYGNFDYDSGAHGFRHIVANSGIPDAVLCINDIMACGVIDVARHEMGIEVPGQMSVVGFDGAASAAWLSYQLTTLHQPVQSMAYAAAAMLTGLIERLPEVPERRVFTASFVPGRTARIA